MIEERIKFEEKELTPINGWIGLLIGLIFILIFLINRYIHTLWAKSIKTK